MDLTEGFSSGNEIFIDLCDSDVDNNDTLESDPVVSESLDQNTGNETVIANIDLCDSDGENDVAVGPSGPIVNLNQVHIIKRPVNILKIFPKHKKNTVGILEYLSDKKEDQIVNEELYTRGYVLYSQHLVSLLTPKSWLNDVVIQNYILLLLKKCESLPFNILCTDTLISFRKNNEKAVDDWLENNHFKIYNTTIIAINPNQNHWALLVANFSTKTIHSLDSFNRTYMNENILVSKFLTLAYNKNLKENESSKTINSYDWTLNIIQCPIQKNDYDCGVFTCTNARYYLQRKKLEYSQIDTQLLRQRIVFELINNQIVEDRACYL